jgi:hypothetical protein
MPRFVLSCTGRQYKISMSAISHLPDSNTDVHSSQGAGSKRDCLHVAGHAGDENSSPEALDLGARPMLQHRPCISHQSNLCQEGQR